MTSVDLSGVALGTGVSGPVLVEFDGQYVWSFVPGRDGARDRSGSHTPWPPVLRPFLSGYTTVTLRAEGSSLLDEEVRFGQGAGRVRVVDGQGHALAVDKVGHLGRIFSESSAGIREEVMAGTQAVLRHLTEACGVAAYLNYGCLLGAVRDGKMIGHDSDSDVCYLSRHSSPADIIAESYAIERRLRELGWHVLRMSGGDLKILLPLSDGRECHIDIFVAFHVAGRFYQLGNRSGDLPASAILPLSTVTLEGHEFPAPRDPEAMLAFIYGPRWRVPDPSFKYDDPPEGVRRLDGWLRGFRTEMGLWTELYGGQSGRIPTGGSPFAVWTRERIGLVEPVVELGSGAGQDAAYFAEQGHPVRALDFSFAAVRRTQWRLRDAGIEHPEVGRVLLNELRSVLSLGAQLARTDTPAHLYARHLVGCLDEPARENLWRLAAMSLRRGTSLFVETPADTSLPPTQALVRRVDVPTLHAEIEAAGLFVAEAETGPGTDMFGEPDPVVHRLRITRPDPTDRRRNP